VAGDDLLRKWEPLDGGSDKPFVANGIVSLEGARIEGDLRCEGGSFLGPREYRGERVEEFINRCSKNQKEAIGD
jgi:hypothetical protein